MAVKTWMPEQHRLTDTTRERMNIPVDFWGARLEGVEGTIDDRPAREVVGHMLTNVRKIVDAGGGIYLYGGAGVGKTSLAVLFAKTVQSWAGVAYFTGVWELRENLRTRTIFDSDLTIMDRCRTVDVLVLDNLRSEDATDVILDARHIEELLSYRSAHRRFTIITSRLAGKALRDLVPSLAETIAMRLVPVELKGEARVAGNDTRRDALLGKKR